jgi:hypothetical protein
MAVKDEAEGTSARLFAWAQRTYRWHRALFIGLNVAITAVNVSMGPPWWGVWPLLVTGLLFTLHFLVYRTSLVDEDWVDERAAEIYDRSYDQGHMEAIAGGHRLETPLERKQRDQRKRRQARKQGRAGPQSSDEALGRAGGAPGSGVPDNPERE